MPRLETSLEEHDLCDDRQALQIFTDCCSAVHVLHTLGVWHRDIKPYNILINKGRAVLIDFTHSLIHRTDDNVLDLNSTTYSHRAPEVFEEQKRRSERRGHTDQRRQDHEKYTEKIDIWSLGCVLFRMVTGSELYDLVLSAFADDGDKADKKGDEKKYGAALVDFKPDDWLQFVSSHLGGIDQHFKNCILLTLQKDPERRPTAEELLVSCMSYAMSHGIGIQVARSTVYARQPVRLIDLSVPSELDQAIKKLSHEFAEYCVEVIVDPGRVSRLVRHILATGLLGQYVNEIVFVCNLLVSIMYHDRMPAIKYNVDSLYENDLDVAYDLCVEYVSQLVVNYDYVLDNY
jgi:serine/threonine protein kinase